MNPSDIRPGARFRICGTVERESDLGNVMVTFDGAGMQGVIPPLAFKYAELLYLPPHPRFTKEQSALIRERLEAGDLADVLDSLTE